MSSSLSIPPLIPLPDDSQSTANDDDDIFATLFSPPTPRASPALTPLPDGPSARHHARTQSVDSEFGSFVSVPSAEDPLRASSTGPEVLPFSPLQNFEFLDRFTDDAKSATEKNKRGLLDELLQHEDDPLYWIQSSTSGHASASVPLSRDRSRTPSGGSVEEESLITIDSERQSRASTRRTEHSVPLRSPSLPPSSPTRLSRPEIDRSQSTFFTPPSFPSRWVSSLLSTATGPPLSRHRSTTPTISASEDDPAQAPPGGSLHARAQTTSSLPIDNAITHGSPFASHPFVPASGAPGFAGDRQWDKGFEFDKTHVDKKGVRLIGRKEMTTAVLSVELADMLRVHLPALARLSRSWSLLYSLDQHGISLNTLYTRCQGHTGSALVIVRDDGDAVFGTWMGEGIHPSKGSYYGSGESFLWRLTKDKRLKVYKWTGRNDYVALCEPEYISFGGGDGHYGLYLDNTLTDGSSARCPTFDNEPLCSAGPRQGDNTTFECVGLEVWGVG